MKWLAGAICLLATLAPARIADEPKPTPTLIDTGRQWKFLNPGRIELHANQNCLSWVIVFRQISEGQWIYTVVPVERTRCRPHPGEYPEEFLFPWL